MWGKMDRTVERVEGGLAVAAAALVFFQMISVVYSVFMRYFLQHGVPWVFDVTTYLLFFVTFLSMPWLLRYGHHVKVELFTESMGKRQQAFWGMVTSSCGLVLSVVLLISGGTVTWNSYLRDLLMMDSLKMPQYALLWCIPFIALFLIYEFTRSIVQNGKDLLPSRIPSASDADELHGAVWQQDSYGKLSRRTS